MRKIIAVTQLTLDGFMQAPGGPDEDPTSRFTHVCGVDQRNAVGPRRDVDAAGLTQVD